MATIAEQLTSLAETKTAIKDAITAKGVSVADTDTFRSYADKIGEIQAGSGEPETKYGATLEDMFIMVDNNGTITKRTETFDFDGTGIKQIGPQAWRYVLAMRAVKNINFPDLERVESYGLSYFCPQANSLKNLDMRKLRRVDGYGLYLMCQSCQNLETINLDSLYNISAAGGLVSAFSGCAKLTKVYLPCLSALGNTNCMSNCFANCTKITEIHLPALYQSTFESQNGYSSKFGATNATIYFDFMTYINIGDDWYERYEPASIYDGDTKTYVGWQHTENGSVVYTQAGTEPVVGTPLYSDAGITQIGTVEYVE